jgi:hypothetical protein
MISPALADMEQVYFGIKFPISPVTACLIVEGRCRQRGQQTCAQRPERFAYHDPKAVLRAPVEHCARIDGNAILCRAEAFEPGLRGGVHQ